MVWWLDAVGPRCREASPGKLLEARPAQDLHLLRRLPPRSRRGSLPAGFPGAPVGRLPPMLPDEVMRTAIPLMVGPPPTFASGVGSHPGILYRLITGQHGLSPWCGSLLGMSEVSPGPLSTREATVVPPPAQPHAREVGDTHPPINAEPRMAESVGVGRGVAPKTEMIPYPKRYVVCIGLVTGRMALRGAWRVAPLSDCHAGAGPPVRTREVGVVREEGPGVDGPGAGRGEVGEAGHEVGAVGVIPEETTIGAGGASR